MAYRDEVIADSPTAYYRLGEASGTTAADEQSAHNGTYVNSPTLGVAASVAGNTAVTFAAASSQRVTLTTLGTLGAGINSTSWEFWVKTTTTAGGSVIGEFNTGTTTAIRIRLNSDSSENDVAGKLSAFVRDNSGNTVRGAITAAIYDGNWHHVAVVVASATTLAIYVDGVSQTVSYATQGTLGAGANFGFAPTIAATNVRGSIQDFANATFDEVAVYPSRLSSARVLAHYNAGASSSDTATMGVATAAGISPTARASAPAGSTGTASGVAPTVLAAASTAAATATGTAPSSSVTATATPGTALAEGIGPQAALSDTPTPGLATTAGTAPSSSTTETPTPGAAAAAGIPPVTGQSQTPTPGLAVAGGVTPGSSAIDTPTPGAAAGSGTAPTSRTSVGPGGATGQGVAPVTAVMVTMGLSTAATITPSVATHTAPGVSVGAGISPDSATVVVVTPGAAAGSGIEPTITRPAVRYRLTPGTRTTEHSLTPGIRPSLSLSASERRPRTLEVS